MVIVSDSLQSTSVTMPAGAANIQSVPTNNKLAANVLAKLVSVLVLVLAVEYERLHLTYTIPYFNKMNYVDWAAKIENFLKI